MPKLMCATCHVELEEDFEPHTYYCPCCGMTTVDFGDEDPDDYTEVYDPDTWE